MKDIGALAPRTRRALARANKTANQPLTLAARTQPTRKISARERRALRTSRGLRAALSH
jgi:hypothetical protein